LIFSNNCSNIAIGGENMLKTHLVLMDELKSYASPAKKIERMVKSGELTRVVRGLYETDPHTPGHLLAASIYGPSYLSFEYALAQHGLIPEAVHQFTSATFDKKRAKQFETPFGIFSYRDIPYEAFSYGILPLIENGYSYRLATPAKAVCDELYKLSPCANRSELEQLLFENLRIDRQAFLELDLAEMEQLAALYQTKNHKLLRSWIRKELRHATDT
jgi:predicted transcriptional regulator of viral defense system